MYASMSKQTRNGDAHTRTRRSQDTSEGWLLGVLQGKAADATEEEGSEGLHCKIARSAASACPRSHRANRRALRRLFPNRFKSFLCSSVYGSFPSMAGAGQAPRASRLRAGAGPHRTAGRERGPRLGALRETDTGVLSLGTALPRGHSPTFSPAGAAAGSRPHTVPTVLRAAPRPLPARPPAPGPQKGLPPPPTPRERRGG